MASTTTADRDHALHIKRALLAAGAVLIALAFAWAMRTKPVADDIEIAGRAPLAVTVDEEGKTAIKNVYAVSAPIAGKVLRTPVKAGDAVEKDVSVVAIIQPPPPSLIDVRGKAELESAASTERSLFSLSFAQLVARKPL